MDLSPAYDAPVIRTLVGADGKAIIVSFPRLDWTDIKNIAGELKAAREVSAETRATQCRLQAWERFRALQEIDNFGVPISVVTRYAATGDGAERIVNMCADRAGLSPDDKVKVVKALGAVGRASLAIDLVSSAEPELAKPAEGASPLVP